MRYYFLIQIHVIVRKTEIKCEACATPLYDKVIDGTRVPIYNVPGKRDMGVVPTGHLEVADILILSNYRKQETLPVNY